MNEDVLTMLNESGEPSANAPEQPHEQDDFDQIINDVLYEGETPDQRKNQAQDELEEDDDSEEPDNGNSLMGQPQEGSNKRSSKTRDRVVRTARQRDEARAKAMEAERKAQDERERRIAAEERYKSLQNVLGLDENQAQQIHHEQSRQQQSQGATFTAEDVEKMINARFSAVEKQYSEAEKVRSEIHELQAAWKENYERTKKSASHVASWFDDEFTKGIGANEKKRELLRAVSAFKYATEALYAASQKDGFDRLPLGSQFKIVHELSNKIDARASQKKQAPRKESIELPAHSSGSAPNRQRTVTLDMDSQSIINAMFARPNPQQQRSR